MDRVVFRHAMCLALRLARCRSVQDHDILLECMGRYLWRPLAREWYRTHSSMHRHARMTNQQQPQPQPQRTGNREEEGEEENHDVMDIAYWQFCYATSSPLVWCERWIARRRLFLREHAISIDMRRSLLSCTRVARRVRRDYDAHIFSTTRYSCRHGREEEVEEDDPSDDEEEKEVERRLADRIISRLVSVSTLEDVLQRRRRRKRRHVSALEEMENGCRRDLIEWSRKWKVVDTEEEEEEDDDDDGEESMNRAWNCQSVKPKDVLEAIRGSVEEIRLMEEELKTEEKWIHEKIVFNVNTYSSFATSMLQSHMKRVKSKTNGTAAALTHKRQLLLQSLAHR